MTPTQVYLWTFGLTIVILISFVLGMWLLLTSQRKRSQNRFGYGLLFILLGVIAPIMITATIGQAYPADHFFYTLDHSTEERDKLRTQNETVKRLRPVMRLYSVVCPDPDLYAAGGDWMKTEWQKYYSSFLQPAPLGPNCYYYKGKPFRSGIEKMEK